MTLDFSIFWYKDDSCAKVLTIFLFMCSIKIDSAFFFHLKYFFHSDSTHHKIADRVLTPSPYSGLLLLRKAKWISAELLTFFFSFWNRFAELFFTFSTVNRQERWRLEPLVILDGHFYRIGRAYAYTRF